MIKDLNKEAERVHAANKPKWWIDINTGLPVKRDVEEMGALALSELSEALEGYRKNLMDDKLPQYPMPVVELVDCVIQMMDTVIGLGFKFNHAAYEVGCTSITDRPFGAHIFLMNKVVAELYTKMHEVSTVSPVHADLVVDDPFQIALHASYRVADLVELSRIFYPDVDFWEVYEAKMKFNAEREDHKLKHRRGKHGKKF